MQQQFDRGGAMSKDNVKVILGRSTEMLSKKLLKIFSFQKHINYDTDPNLGKTVIIFHLMPCGFIFIVSPRSDWLCVHVEELNVVNQINRLDLATQNSQICHFHWPYGLTSCFIQVYVYYNALPCHQKTKQ